MWVDETSWDEMCLVKPDKICYFRDYCISCTGEPRKKANVAHWSYKFFTGLKQIQQVIIISWQSWFALLVTPKTKRIKSMIERMVCKKTTTNKQTKLARYTSQRLSKILEFVSNYKAFRFCHHKVCKFASTGIWQCWKQTVSAPHQACEKQSQKETFGVN